MIKAYWDIIQEDINKDPPVLDMVFKLCADIKYVQLFSNHYVCTYISRSKKYHFPRYFLLNRLRAMLLELLLPHQNAMRGRIDELFDIDLIRQRCEHAKSAEPLRDYGPAVLDIMQRLCCPMRDEEIELLRKVDDTVHLFQGIVRVLEEMKLDFANFLIKQIRPVVHGTIQNYEKEKMKEIEEAQRIMGVEDPLVNTKAWLQRAFQDLYSTNNQMPSGTKYFS